jgi:hypothetical protein
MDWFLLIFAASSVFVNILLLAGIFLIFMKTPAGTFISAWLSHAPVLLRIGKEQLAEFVVGKGAQSGTMTTKAGPYFVTENSQLHLRKINIPLFVAFSRFGATFPVEFAAWIQKLKEQGLTFNKFDEFKKACAANQDMQLFIEPHKTIRMHDLSNTFPNNVNPSYMEEHLSNELAKRSKWSNLIGNPGTWVIAAICICGILGAIWFLTKGKTQACSCMCQAAQTAIKNLTG